MEIVFSAQESSRRGQLVPVLDNHNVAVELEAMLSKTDFLHLQLLRIRTES